MLRASNVRVWIDGEEFTPLSMVRYIPPFTLPAWAQRPWRNLSRRQRRRVHAIRRAYTIRVLTHR